MEDQGGHNLLNQKPECFDVVIPNNSSSEPIYGEDDGVVSNDGGLDQNNSTGGTNKTNERNGNGANLLKLNVWVLLYEIIGIFLIIILIN